VRSNSELTKLNTTPSVELPGSRNDDDVVIFADRGRDRGAWCGTEEERGHKRACSWGEKEKETHPYGTPNEEFSSGGNGSRQAAFSEYSGDFVGFEVGNRVWPTDELVDVCGSRLASESAIVVVSARLGLRI
jgi:hypothetical protein